MKRVDFELVQNLYDQLVDAGMNIDVKYYGNTAVVRINGEDCFTTQRQDALNTFISGIHTGYVIGKGLA